MMFYLPLRHIPLQDQVGGLFAGFKMGFSKPEIPLHVQVAPLEVDRGFASRLNDHLLLLYTGIIACALVC